MGVSRSNSEFSHEFSVLEHDTFSVLQYRNDLWSSEGFSWLQPDSDFQSLKNCIPCTFSAGVVEKDSNPKPGVKKVHTTGFTGYDYTEK